MRRPGQCSNEQSLRYCTREQLRHNPGASAETCDALTCVGPALIESNRG